jgi:propionyl-CoA carboxylase alpha chain
MRLRVHGLSAKLPAVPACTRFFSADAEKQPFSKILIANRGEIACRVISTAKRMSIKTVAVYSQAEPLARHVQMADEAYCIGPAASSESYLNIPRILDVIKKSGAQAVHPGYGFLSENAEFCKAVEDMGVAFIGPPASAMMAMGDKIRSKQIAMDAKVNTIPGFQGVIKDEEDAVRVAKTVVGYPVMIKASAGGGGKGMRIAYDDEGAREGFRLSTQEARKSFGDDRLFVEKYIENPHHIEIQLVADTHGKVVCFPERECSIQRRNQKVLEESPSMLLTPETRAKMCAQATMLAKAVGYTSAGTIEFLVDEKQNFYFLEMNTRLQVEHPVTEFVGRVDLVEQMLRVAAKQPISAHLSTENAAANINGWALEARVYAEDPLRGFLPSNGSLLELREPRGATAFDLKADVRVDSGLMEGMSISTHYDPMISKLIAHGKTRDECIDRMASALDEYVIKGSASFAHNTSFLHELCRSERFRRGATPTSFIPEEYPDGFKGVALRPKEVLRTVAAAIVVHTTRATTLSRPVGAEPFADAAAAAEWVVTLSDDGHSAAMQLLGGPREFKVTADDAGLHVTPVAGGPTETMSISCDWANESPLVEIDDGAGPKVVQYFGRSESSYCAYRFNTCGATLRASVLSPDEHAASAHMLPPEVKDTSNMIQSPMPGVLISVSVVDGQAIQAGQEVCVVEAMKMQNVLRAPRAGVVATVLAKAGDSLTVDQLIATLQAK